ncbi:MAG: DbpA RNA binding domain-containing protein, partial [Candidatus Aminicenantes bacterium]|nr:DbpA RNA binding domain-containing protein [Candidatus Aminicenantes bacterium]
MIDRMEKVDVADSEIDPYLEVIYKKLDWLTKEQVIKQFVSLEFNRFLEYYKDSPDLNIDLGRKGKKERGRERGKERERGPKLNKGDVARFFVKSGRKDKVEPPHIIGMINDMTGTKNIEIGKIEIMSTFSFFEVDINSSDIMLKNLDKAELHGVKVYVDKADAPGGGRKKEKSNKRPFPKTKKKKFKGKTKIY